MIGKQIWSEFCCLIVTVTVFWVQLLLLYFSLHVFTWKNVIISSISTRSRILIFFFFIEVRSPTKDSLTGSSVSIRLWENNSGPEVPFSLHEKVAVPPTHQMKPGPGQKELKNGAGDDSLGTARGRRHGAILEENFIGSDDDGVCLLGLSYRHWHGVYPPTAGQLSFTLLKHV